MGMKHRAIFLSLFLTAGSLLVCEGSTTLAGTAIADADDTSGSNLAGELLGIYVADTGDDGFSASSSSALLAPGDSLQVGSGFGSVDDVIFARDATNASGFGSTSFGGGPTYDPNVYGGYDFGVYIFTDVIDSSSLELVGGVSYGFVRSSASLGEWTLPSSAGEFDFAANPSTNPNITEFQQISSAQFGDLTVAIPEPSAYATILGLLGLGYAVFCRRRRSSSTD